MRMRILKQIRHPHHLVLILPLPLLVLLLLLLFLLLRVLLLLLGVLSSAVRGVLHLLLPTFTLCHGCALEHRSLLKP
jgi:hypothetical protein